MRKFGLLGILVIGVIKADLCINSFNDVERLTCPSFPEGNYDLGTVAKPQRGTRKVTINVPASAQSGSGRSLSLRGLNRTPVRGVATRSNTGGWTVQLFVPSNARQGSHELAIVKVIGDSRCNYTGMSESDYYKMLAQSALVAIKTRLNEDQCSVLPPHDADDSAWLAVLNQLADCYISTRNSPLRKRVEKNCPSGNDQVKFKVTVN